MADMLSQEEINALLGGDDDAADEGGGVAPESGGGDGDLDSLLTSSEKDVLGELGNISIGTSATTLFALLGQRVIITTPRVSIIRLADIAEKYDRPCVGTRVDYVEGIKGTNVLLLNQTDVKIITHLMMGWEGEANVDEDINEMDLSAIQEVMNQMVGSASTSLASLVDTRIDIATPIADIVDFSNDKLLEDLGFDEEHAVCIEFRMEIGTLVDSSIMQLLPMDFAKYMVDMMTAFITTEPEPTPEVAAPAAAPATAPAAAATTAPQQLGMEANTAMANTNPAQAAAPSYQQPQYAPHAPVAGQPAQFTNFDITEVMQQKENIEIIMDVPLEVTVELGRTTRKIKEILSFSPGSIIELNKLAGEPIDILVNGKFVAKGEVVVIDENFGIRITDIVNAEHRI